MPIPVRCSCGRSYQLRDDLAGKRVRCAGCQEPITVPRPDAVRDAEDQALQALLAEEPTPTAPKRSMPGTRPPAEDEEARRAVRPAGPAAPSWSKEARGDKPRKRKRSLDEPYESTGGGIAVHREIVAGILMMVGAAVWFFLGLAANRFFIYPPILFVLGIAAVIRGFTQRP